MATPIYKAFMFKPQPAAYLMEDEQREAIFAQLEVFQKQVGARGLLMADMVWSNEEYEYFGIEEFPSMQALIEYHNCLRSVGWFGYVQGKSFVGYSVDIGGNPVDLVIPPPPAAGDDPLYKMYLVSNSQIGYQNSDRAEQMLSEFAKPTQDMGVLNVMNIFTRMTNEEWLGVGLERYPNEQSLLEVYKLMELKNWFQYVASKTFVGKPVAGLFHEQR